MLRTALPACGILPAVNGKHDERIVVQMEVNRVGCDRYDLVGR